MPKIKSLILLFFVTGSTICIAQDTAKTAHKRAAINPAGKAAAVYQAPVTAPQAGAQPSRFPPTPASTDKTLDGQYQYVIGKTYRYQQAMVTAFWKNVSDTLAAQRATIKASQIKIAQQEKKLAKPQEGTPVKEESAPATSNGNISILGIELAAGTYSMVMWALVLGLGITLTIVIFKTTSSRAEGKYRAKLFEELQADFQAYKAKANDKEKKLARELQTERNKVEELMGRG